MPKKYLNLILITIGFVIWMFIFYRIVFEDNSDNEYSMEQVDSKQNTGKNSFIKAEMYPGDELSDPFITPYNYSPPKPKVIKVKKEKKPQNLPRLSLLGILSDQEGPMAIIGFPDNTIQFVREKQKLENITIDKIDSSIVFYRIGKTRQEMSLD